MATTTLSVPPKPPLKTRLGATSPLKVPTAVAGRLLMTSVLVAVAPLPAALLGVILMVKGVRLPTLGRPVIKPVTAL